MINDSILDKFNCKLQELDNFLTILCNNNLAPQQIIDTIRNLEKIDDINVSSNSTTTNQLRDKKRKTKFTNSKIKFVKLPLERISNRHSKLRKRTELKSDQEKRLRVCCDKLKKYKFFKTRRENVDKKILRFMKIHIKSSNTITRTPFLNDFIKNKFNVPYKEGSHVYNSVSYSYLSFLHSHAELTQVYKSLMLNSFDYVYDSLVEN